MLAIVGSGLNIHLSQQATTTMAPGIMSNKMTARLQDGSKIDSSQIATLQLSGLRKKAKKTHIFPKMKTFPLISLEVLCDDGCTITIDK